MSYIWGILACSFHFIFLACFFLLSVYRTKNSSHDFWRSICYSANLLVIRFQDHCVLFSCFCLVLWIFYFEPTFAIVREINAFSCRFNVMAFLFHFTLKPLTYLFKFFYTIRYDVIMPLFTKSFLWISISIFQWLERCAILT